MAICPNCKQDMSPHYIDAHLDQCHAYLGQCIDCNWYRTDELPTVRRMVAIHERQQGHMAVILPYGDDVSGGDARLPTAWWAFLIMSTIVIITLPLIGI